MIDEILDIHLVERRDQMHVFIHLQGVDLLLGRQSFQLRARYRAAAPYDEKIAAPERPSGEHAPAAFGQMASHDEPGSGKWGNHAGGSFPNTTIMRRAPALLSNGCSRR